MAGGDDYLVEPRGRISGITYDELHAVLLAIVPGWAVGVLFVSGMVLAAASLAVALIAATGLIRAGALARGARRKARSKEEVCEKVPGERPGKAVAAIWAEPWWWLTSLALNILLGTGAGVWIPV